VDARIRVVVIGRLEQIVQITGNGQSSVRIEQRCMTSFAFGAVP
jgi:hypothetical protein